MATQVGIINMALSKIGDWYIDTIADTTKQCTFALLHWDTVRDALIESYPWNFAIKRAKLDWAGTTPAFGYDHEWTLPTDYSRALMVSADDDLDNSVSIDFKIEGGVLRTSENEVYLEYVAGVTTPASWPPSFCSLMACNLAALLAEPLGGMSETAKQQLMVDREMALVQAQANDFNERSNEVLGYYQTIGCRE